MRGHDLEGDEAVENRLAGLVNCAHAALTELGKDFVASECLACQFRHDTLG